MPLGDGHTKHQTEVTQLTGYFTTKQSVELVNNKPFKTTWHKL